LAPPALPKAAAAALKAKNALMKKFMGTQANVLKGAKRRAMYGPNVADSEVVKMELNQRRWHWVDLLWRHSGMAKVPLPPVSREDCPLGFVIVHPNTMRHVVQTCEIGPPVAVERALRGSSRGSVSFELDFRRHFRPKEVRDPSIPCPVEASFLNAPQPPLERLAYLKMGPKDSVPVPTTPWGTIPPTPFGQPTNLADPADPADQKKAFIAEGPAG
jgi:hypothetical protein